MKKFEIFQLNKENYKNFAFRPLELITERGPDFKFSLSRYDKVYEGFRKFTTQNDFLEDLFREFNINRPSDFTGWSMSVGDVVKFDDRLFYCDMLGWKEVSEGATIRELLKQ